MTDTTELLKRLEAGETGREIDAEVWCAVLPNYTFEKLTGGRCAATGWIAERGNVSATQGPCPPITTSLNAAVALVERDEDVLTLEASNTPVGPFARIVTTQADYKGVGATPAAALVAALLKAKGAGDE